MSRDFWFRREFDFTPADSVRRSSYERTVAVLQHHGVPTRLLDATADPLVGLYFAVVGRFSASDMDDVDGAVVFIRNVGSGDNLPIHVVAAPLVSERVSAQRAHFIAPMPDGKPGTASGDTIVFDFFNVSATNGSLTNFDNLIDNYLTGSFSRGDRRQKRQTSSRFTLPRELKAACRDVLRSMGISAKTLFPGSEGFRKELAGL